jgi:hypothetical protein
MVSCYGLWVQLVLVPNDFATYHNAIVGDITTCRSEVLQVVMSSLGTSGGWARLRTRPAAPRNSFCDLSIFVLPPHLRAHVAHAGPTVLRASLCVHIPVGALAFIPGPDVVPSVALAAGVWNLCPRAPSKSATLGLSSVWSSHEPNLTLLELRQLPIYPLGLYTELESRAKAAWQSGLCLLCGLLLKTYLPFWAIEFSKQMLVALDLQAAWSNGHIFLKTVPQQAPPHLQHIWPAVEHLFGALGYNQVLARNLKVVDIIHLFSKCWINDTVIDGVVNVLNTRLQQLGGHYHYCYIANNCLIQ